MDKKDEELEYIEEDNQEESTNNFEEPDYGNYDYNETAEVPTETVNNEIPQEIPESGTQIAEPTQNVSAPTENVNTNSKSESNHLSDIKDKNSGKEAYAKTLDNKNYYDDELAKNRKNQKELQKNLADAKKDNKEKTNTLDQKKQETQEKRNNLKDARKKKADDQGVGSKVQDVKSRRAGIRNSISELRGAKKDEKNAAKDKKESDDKLEKSKDDLRNNRNERKKLLDDKQKSKKFQKKHPLQAAKMRASNLLKKVKKLIIAKVLLPILLIIIVFAILVDVIYEVFEAVDTAITYVANVQEKIDNFVNGLGFQNSEEVFYDELEELQKEYNNKIDVPLLLSTLFYDDIQNNMDPSEVDADVVQDEESLVSFATVVDYVVDKFKESNETVGADGKRYSSNKIYRMRMLAKNMVEKTGVSEPVTFGRYLKINLKRMGKAVAKIFNLRNIIRILLGSLVEIPGLIEDFAGIITGSEIFETTDIYNFVKDKSPIAGGIELIKAIFSTFADIEDVSLCAGASYNEKTGNVKYKDADGNEQTINSSEISSDESTYDWGIVCIKYATYNKASDNYFNYLKEYYIPKMPEFRKYLNSEDPKIREEEIDRVIAGIKDIYEDYKYYFELPDGDVEMYNDYCVGSLNNNLVSQLGKPVTVGTMTKIDGRDAFGIVDGYKQNGIILTSSNSGITAGGEVYPIYDGIIAGIGRSTGETSGDTTAINSSFKSYQLTDDELKAIASQCHAEQGGSGIEGVKAEASLMANLYEYKGTSYESVYDYVKNGKWFAHSKMHMNPICSSPSNNRDACCSGSRCYSYYYTDEELSVVRDVLNNGNRSLPQYVDEHDSKSDITSITLNGNTYTDITSINNEENYISNLTTIKTRYGATYTFYSFPTSGSDPFGYTKGAYDNYSHGSSVETENNTNWIKIEHDSLTLDGQSYKITSIYKYLGDIAGDTTVGKRVTKGQVIGHIGQVNGYSEPSMYFELIDKNGTSVNPTNMFISCEGKELVGNSNKEKVWFYFLDNGFTKAGAAAAIGNLIHEGGFKPNNLENTVEKNTGYTDERFTQEVDSGIISRSEFICSKRFWLYGKPSDSCKNNGYEGGVYGYGLFGFTYPTIKENLAQHTIDVGVSIGDLKAQLDSFVDYLSKNNSSLLNTLKTTTDPRAAAEAILLQFERPASIDSPDTRAKAIRDRGESAQKVYDEMKDVVRPAPVPTGSESHQVNSYGFIWPTKSTHITSYYGNRSAPTAGATTDHKAIDIGGSIGDPIYAVASGTVYRIDQTPNRGIYILIKHDNGFMTRYQHLNKVLVTVNSRVNQGDIIAELGKTGIGTGPHLHFEIFRPDITPELGWSSNASNPLDYISPPTS